jgi:DNA-binding NarL/FixJ family response regulator
MDILLADDQPQVRSALRLLLEQNNAIHVTGECSHLEELVETIRASHADLILLDWELPGLETGEHKNAPQAYRLEITSIDEIKSHQPDIKVIALSGRPEARQAAMDGRADAFVSKADPPETLQAVLDELLSHPVESQEDSQP